MGIQSKHKHLDFTIIDNQEKAYIIGFVGADGCLSGSRSNYSIIIDLAAKDLDILEKIRDIVSPSRGIKVYARKRKGSVSKMAKLLFCNKTLYYQLLGHNLTPRKSLMLKPPEALPHDLIPHYIRGLFDGDGTVYSTDKHLLQCGVVGSKYIINFIHIEFSKSHSNNSMIHQENNVYVIKYSSLNAIKFIKWIYKDAHIYLKRKYEIAKPFLEYESEFLLRREWTKQEINLLKKNYPSKPKEYILSLLPDFNWGAIQLKASRLHIKRDIVEGKSRKIWTGSDIQLLKSRFNEYNTVSALQKFFPDIGYTTLYRKCKALSLLEEV